jgi:hypothetical protein
VPTIATFGLFNSRTVEAAAQAAGAAVGGAVGSSVGGGAGGGGGGGGAGDPLSLIFLVQGVAVTAKISSMPAMYRDGFASGFSSFNLAMAPPGWAKDFMQLRFLGPMFQDDSDKTRAMRGHFFFSTSTFLFTTSWHLAYVYISNRLGLEVPKTLAYPQVLRI